MPRSKGFEPSEALEKAMRLFWQNGYEKTSVCELLQVMGINRGSMYDTFGDKQALFLAALKRYEETKSKQLLLFLEREGPVRETLYELFSQLPHMTLVDGKKCGCFMVNTANEISIHNQRITQLVQRNFNLFHEGFERILLRGKKTGELSLELDACSTARFLTNSFIGLATISKVTTDPEVLTDIVKTTLSLVR